MKLLEGMINQHNQEKQRLGTRPMRKLHPSTIGMCGRRVVFDMLMVPKAPIDSQLIRIFDNGHGMHHRYETMFAEMGILVQAEMKLEDEDISGHTDALIRIPSFMQPQGEDILVELKSAMSKSYEWMVKNNKPKTEHREQLMFYLRLSGVGKGIIFVENKDTQEVWEYHLTYDSVEGETLMQRARSYIRMARERQLPPIPRYHTPSNYKCATCPYNFYCHQGSVKNDGSERYPIPFVTESQVFYDVYNIILAINNGQPIPDVIQGSTNGDLVREVAERNQLTLTQRWM